MPLGLSSKKTSSLAAKPEAMSSEVTLVDSSHTRSDKQAAAGPSSKKTKMTWKEARAQCKKEENWETRVRAMGY
ncbi:uncharacterized protein TrAtP1_002992 [Trichoderma atroviride]|uniref:uncharacterized protein n=1 Tax=Hypocrea atroviridis TaxID=63577 RepID=UPI00332AA740|nr:hypothetical protein TrAtP1_002992 [Trichoderma atroviride]